MNSDKLNDIIGLVLENLPKQWLELTTHRLDIYNEKKAKTEFLESFERLLESENIDSASLMGLPTAYDYIRLGHPLSCFMEWVFSQKLNLPSNNIISFSSQTMPLLSILRKNLSEGKETTVYFENEPPESLNLDKLKDVYGYQLNSFDISENDTIPSRQGSRVVYCDLKSPRFLERLAEADFVIGYDESCGSIILVNERNKSYISEIQHVRRRESIAMTPDNCLKFLKNEHILPRDNFNRENLNEMIKKVTNTSVNPAIGSSGLSIQYAIMMGLVDDAEKNFKGKPIKFIVPPNCYGGTNDQARRVAACLSHVEVLDLEVDSGKDMVSSIDQVLSDVAKDDGVPYIIAEIPTNPRVEVPNLVKLSDVLTKRRIANSGQLATSPVFILDQTFCPNVNFFGVDGHLTDVNTISYVSGSKFPSGGLCTAGYCVANDKAKDLMPAIQSHLKLCDNEATKLQLQILEKQMPSMLDRIEGAYVKTREFVDHIEKVLPQAKINFVSKELAQMGFTPSVFSLDLPTKGETKKQQEKYKRELNLKLISKMIGEIPLESKYCVSYGQLKGCYWTIPATSTQGTTKEGDKDYIVRVALSSDLDLERHKEVFSHFCQDFMTSDG